MQASRKLTNTVAGNAEGDTGFVCRGFASWVAIENVDVTLVAFRNDETPVRGLDQQDSYSDDDRCIEHDCGAIDD
jgi:hypothetical protein